MATRRYRIESMLGRGSYGAVYRATLLGDDGFEKPVAIKVVESDIDNAQERLIDEARILGRLRHRAIPAVDGLVRLDGELRALVLEYVDGAELGTFVRNVGPMPPGPLAQLGAEVASALAFAWGAEGPDGPLGMVHRDVKLSNIMLTPGGDVRLLDFGIARGRMDRAAKTQTGMVVGTARYMAPDAFAGRSGPKVDVFALGITLVNLRTPVTQTLGLLTGAEYLNARDALIAKADLSRDWGTLIREMLHPKPERRPTSSEVARRLEGLAEDVGGQGLRAWAREAWEALPEEVPLDDDPYLGRVFTEVEPPHKAREAPPPAMSAWVGLGAGLSLSVLSLGAVAAVVALGLVAGLGWWWWNAPLPDVRLAPRAVTSDANPEQGIAIDARGRLFYVDGDRVVRDGEVLPAAEGARFVSVTADGSRLAAWIDGGIELVNPDGSERRPLGEGAVPTLSPDGRYLAYHHEDGLMLRDLSTGAERLLSEGHAHGRWSPGSDLIASPEPEGLRLIDVETGTSTVLDLTAVDVAITHERIWLRTIHGHVDDLSWLPRSNPHADPVHVYTTAARLEELVAAPDGPLAWTESMMHYDLTLHPIEDDGLGPATPVAVSGRWFGQSAQVTDDGSVIGSVWTPGEGTGTVQVERLDRSGQRHALAQVSAVSGHQVLDDGRLVFWDKSDTPRGFLFGESPYGGMHLVVVPPEGEPKALMPLSDANVDAWRLDPTGQVVAVLTHDREVRMGPLGSDLTPSETRIDGVDALLAVSTDGSLVLAADEGLVLWSEGTQRTIVPAEKGEVREAVWLDERWLLAHTDDQLLKVDVPRRRVQTLATYDMVTRQRRGLSVSPNRRWVLLDHSEVHGDVWVADILPE